MEMKLEFCGTSFTATVILSGVMFSMFTENEQSVAVKKYFSAFLKRRDWRYCHVAAPDAFWMQSTPESCASKINNPIQNFLILADDFSIAVVRSPV